MIITTTDQVEGRHLHEPDFCGKWQQFGGHWVPDEAAVGDGALSGYYPDLAKK